MGDVPVVTGDVPVVMGDVPVVTGDSPVVTGDVPVVTGDGPDVTGDGPVVTGDSPIVTGDSPDVTGDGPVVTGDGPIVSLDCLSPIQQRNAAGAVIRLEMIGGPVWRTGAAIFVTSLASACGAATELFAPTITDAGFAGDVVIPQDGGSTRPPSQPDAQTDAVTTPDAPIGVTVTATRIVAGDSHTCAITTAGGAECWGDDAFGQLGNGGSGQVTPQPVTGLTGVAALAADAYATCAVMTGGQAMCWGNDQSGQLGVGSFGQAVYSPTLVAGISSAVGVAGGGVDATCLLLSSGSVECMGGDFSGNLALGSITGESYDTPQASTVEGAVAIAGSGIGVTPNCALFADGSVKCWGQMSYSLGDGSTHASGTPIRVSGVQDAVQVAVTNDDICIVHRGGSLSCWGYNAWGQLGDGTTSSRFLPAPANVTNVASVSMGEGHVCVVTTQGAVLCVGWNQYGQLGNGTTAPPYQPTTSWQEVIQSEVSAVACGTSHTCALMTNGRVQCWGYNASGQLGDGTTTNRDAPVSVIGF